MRTRFFAAFALALAMLAPAARADPQHGGLQGPVEVRTPMRVRIVELHGHYGPYVVLGYRAGLLARRLLKSPGYFDLKCVVESPLAPPPSCLVDGVQLGAGCTLGKRNIELRGGKIGRVAFTTKAGRLATVALRKELPAKIATWIDKLGVEKAGDLCARLPEEQLFEVKSGPPAK
jgi:formylmethanofuran dehydrogenase subunit E